MEPDETPKRDKEAIRRLRMASATDLLVLTELVEIHATVHVAYDCVRSLMIGLGGDKENIDKECASALESDRQAFIDRVGESFDSAEFETFQAGFKESTPDPKQED